MKLYHLVMVASLVVAVTPQRNNIDTLGLHAKGLNELIKKRACNHTTSDGSTTLSNVTKTTSTGGAERESSRRNTDQTEYKAVSITSIDAMLRTTNELLSEGRNANQTINDRGTYLTNTTKTASENKTKRWLMRSSINQTASEDLSITSAEIMRRNASETVSKDSSIISAATLRRNANATVSKDSSIIFAATKRRNANTTVSKDSPTIVFEAAKRNANRFASEGLEKLGIFTKATSGDSTKRQLMKRGTNQTKSLDASIDVERMRRDINQTLSEGATRLTYTTKPTPKYKTKRTFLKRSADQVTDTDVLMFVDAARRDANETVYKDSPISGDGIMRRDASETVPKWFPIRFLEDAKRNANKIVRKESSTSLIQTMKRNANQPLSGGSTRLTNTTESKSTHRITREYMRRSSNYTASSDLSMFANVTRRVANETISQNSSIRYVEDTKRNGNQTVSEGITKMSNTTKPSEYKTERDRIKRNTNETSKDFPITFLEARKRNANQTVSKDYPIIFFKNWKRNAYQTASEGTEKMDVVNKTTSEDSTNRELIRRATNHTQFEGTSIYVADKRNIVPGFTEKEAGRESPRRITDQDREEQVLHRDTPKRQHLIEKAEREATTSSRTDSVIYGFRFGHTIA